MTSIEDGNKEADERPSSSLDPPTTSIRKEEEEKDENVVEEKKENTHKLAFRLPSDSPAKDILGDLELDRQTDQMDEVCLEGNHSTSSPNMKEENEHDDEEEEKEEEEIIGSTARSISELNLQQNISQTQETPQENEEEVTIDKEETKESERETTVTTTATTPIESPKSPQNESAEQKESIELTASATANPIPTINKPKTTILHNSEETTDETFNRLSEGIRDGSITHKHIIDSVFNVLVGGPFDLENRFIIEDSASISRMLSLLESCSEGLQAEMWSVFVAVVRKSNRNLEACSRVGLISKILNILPTCSAILSDLLVQLLGVLTSYSITVKETKYFLRSLQAINNAWPRNSLKLLQVMKEMPQRDGADVFFSFPGKANAGIIVPPLSKFPYQNGYTFSTWFRMDPLNSVTFEKEQPILYCFRTNKGAGYSAHFTGNCLVINAEKAKGKVQSKCIKAELTPRKWHHIAIAHNYSRWTKGEIKCYVDGQLVETIDMNWACTASEHFDRCSIGISPEGDTDSAFCGQMGAIYVFSEALSLQQVNSLFCLGPAYQSTFKHDAESHLPDGYKKHLFDGRLNASLLMAYCPKNCHGQLCLHSPSKTTASNFVQIPHAVMKGGVEVITTHSIDQSLQSVGGIQILLPLFSQLDLPYEDGSTVDIDVCGTLLSLISLLLSSSQTSQQQLFHSKGFLIIAHALQRAKSSHLTMSVVERVIGMAKFLLRCPAGVPLLKQLFDHILFNPRLWSTSDSNVQLHLYQYLASDFLANANFPQILRRVPTVVEMCHALKHYYYVVEPKAPSQYMVEARNSSFPSQHVVSIRSSILAFINRMIIMNAEESPDGQRDEEIHTLLNFVATVHEDDNLYDVLSLLTRLLADHPAIMIPALDRNRALGVLFKLLASPNQLIRIPALKMFGYFLQRSTFKRKQDSVAALNLFTLISERLLIHATYLSVATYNVLYEILVEQMTPSYSYAIHNPPNPETKFENPQMLKVIANLIQQSEESEETLVVKKAFLLDMINMCRDSRENRRTILQMSVWQDWLISLSYVYPNRDAEVEISELVFEMFCILLNHAIRFEYGGWRVWVDTLAIAHSKVSWEKFRLESTSPTPSDNSPPNNGGPSESSPSDRPSPIYRTPEFSWSKVHLRLLSDLLTSIETVVEDWKQHTTPLVDLVNASEQQVFVANTVHVISQLADSVIMACGGLLPLLASATSPNSELEIADSTAQELPIEAAADLLSRFVNLTDVFVFVSGVSFAELEQEKNMPSGGVLRQTLRLVATASVRHLLACRVASPGSMPFDLTSPKGLQIRKFVSGALSAQGKEGITDFGRLLQDVDLQRIKGIVYRDMEENRQAQFLALAVIYLVSVLMVSRYRDILEPPTSPSPFFNSTTTEDTNQNESSKTPLSTNGHSTGENHVNNKQADSPDGSKNDSEDTENEKEEVDEEEKREENAGISSIRVTPGQINTEGPQYKADELNKLQSGGSSQRTQMEPGERRVYLTNNLQTALETTAPLLREIMADFRSFLQKTLLGTHGQEIMNDIKVMETLKNKSGSVIELVMLLCSQEWQTSLQKHAGLAFIELVNEGRLMAHATRDHVLRVSNEADFILNRLRAEDVNKHAQFESETAEQLLERREQEARCDHVIASSRRRDSLIASKLLDKMTTILRSPSGAWSSGKDNNELFWRLDVWEDDSRRRKRFVPNVAGTRHEEAAAHVEIEENEKGESPSKDEEARLRELSKSVAPSRPQPLELVDESDIDKWAAEVDPPPPNESTSYSTPAKLIAPGLLVPGTLSITANDLYFDADEEDPLFKQQDLRQVWPMNSL
ncbi:unnamed protein product, partial [Mesorhabditis belari]|uniref:BEACH-type PH domain-containing protein n=1 Tax=Mesorhabditis belari TaxID=2138241 RepID=A0AAF3E964_9BILA